LSSRSESEELLDHDTLAAFTGIAPELSLLLDSRVAHGNASRALQVPGKELDLEKKAKADGDPSDLEKEAQNAEKEALKQTEQSAKYGAEDVGEAIKTNKHAAEVDKQLEEDAKTAAELTGVKPNKHGDAHTMLVTCMLNTGIVTAIFIVFSGLRRILPMNYAGNVFHIGPPQTARAGEGLPPKLEDPGEHGFFAWIIPCFKHDVDDAWTRGGLDAALTLKFCDLGMDILGRIGVPMVCIMCPLHYFYGGDAAEDQLSSLAMGNVINHHPWMYYLHAVIVNMVTYFIVNRVYASMNMLLGMRYRWLKTLPAPRCRTVLVENIPEDFRSDDRLLTFFKALFPGHASSGEEKVHSAKVVKDAPQLQARFEEEEYNKMSLRTELQSLDKEQLEEKASALGATNDEISKAKSVEDAHDALIHLIIDTIVQQSHLKEKDFDKATTGGASLSALTDTVKDTCVGCRKAEDRIAFYEKEIARLDPIVDKLRTTALEQALETGGINCAAGFVTFTDRREAEICHSITISKELSEWRISIPPPAIDVRYSDLKATESQRKVYECIGVLLICMLYIVYIPITCLGTNVEHLVHMGYFQPLWHAFAPGLALMLFLSFLPTVFLLIFRSFFCLISDTFAQHKLQVWYTYFLIFFVLLVTVIGRSLLQTIADVAREPRLIFELMATQMPKATHFYMDFLMLQWWDEAKALLRPFVTFKFVLFKYIFKYSPEESRELSEPEDQDFDGIGARTSHLLICLLVGVVFSTLSPIIAILGLIFFVIARVVYAYLIIYAETRKPDLGGVFFHKQLSILLVGLGIYNCLMIGVLLFRARTKFPMFIALPSLIYTYTSIHHFGKNFVWKSIPLEEVCWKDTPGNGEDNGLRYLQSEFFVQDGSDLAAEKALRRATTSRINLS